MDPTPDTSPLLERIANLEARIARLEEEMGFDTYQPLGAEPAVSADGQTASEESLEERIGTNWFARLGIITLATGVGFLLTLPYAALPAFAPGIAGILIATAIITFAELKREKLAHIAGYLLGGGIALLFFSVLRFSFFSTTPAIESRTVLTVLLMVSVCTGLFFAVRRRSTYLTGLCLLLGYAAAIIADSPAVLFVSVIVLSLIAVAYDRRFHSPGILAVAAALNTLALFVWTLNSPVLGRSIRLLDSPSASPLIVLAAMLVIAAGSLQRKQEGDTDGFITFASAINGAGSYLLFLFMTLAAFKDGPVVMHVVAHVALLATATIFWVRNKSLYSTFVYVMLGYMALTVAIIKAFPSPDHYIWLSWQSVLVVATAVWFRSRFIVVANFFIYLMLFAAYLVLAGTVSLISLSFGVVALLTARILKAFKHRLELKTEVMRNAYLGCMFVMFPYTLYHTVPKEVVSLSWLAVALFYYLMARAVTSPKYRWMALLTLLLTVVHVLAVDITNLDPAYRIISFVVIGVVLLVISVRYAKQREKKTDATDSPPEKSSVHV